MPTEDRLNTIDIDYVKRLLVMFLTSVKPNNSLFVLQQVYELGIILICYKRGYNVAANWICKELWLDWNYLRNARNVTSHNLYNREEVYNALLDVINSNIVVIVCQYTLLDSQIADKLIQYLIKAKDVFGTKPEE